jgi:hypothetical protein
MPPVMRSIKQLWVLVSVLALSACASAGRQAAWEAGDGAGGGTGTSTSGAAALLGAANAAWVQRDDKAQLNIAIEKWEAAAKADPKNAEAMVWLARAYYFLVDGHLNNEEPENLETLRLELHQKAVDWGERALLLLDPKFEASMRGGGEFEKAIALIEKPAVPAAYWYCTNLSRFANAKGLSARLFYKDRVAAAMRRIKEIDPGYFYAGPDRYFGAFYSALPSIAGKDLDKSAEHFKAAQELSAEYLPTKAVQAEFLAKELDDREMYERLLNEVLAGGDTENPDIAAENRAAKRAAQRMLKLADDIF